MGPTNETSTYNNNVYLYINLRNRIIHIWLDYYKSSSSKLISCKQKYPLKNVQGQ